MLRFLAPIAALLSLTMFALPIQAKEVTCKGRIYRQSPPIPNHPTHLWNVVWRNAQFVRETCYKKLAASKSGSTQPTAIPPQQK